MIIKHLRNNHKEVLEKFKVKASDRTYQVRERNALSTSFCLCSCSSPPNEAPFVSGKNTCKQPYFTGHSPTAILDLSALRNT